MSAIFQYLKHKNNGSSGSEPKRPGLNALTALTGAGIYVKRVLTHCDTAPYRDTSQYLQNINTILFMLSDKHD